MVLSKSDLATQSPSHGLLEQSVVVQGKQAFSQWLDLIRWIAALSVVLAHASNRFFVRLTSLDSAHRSVPFYVFTILAGFAHEAVMVFFVLSGYLVGGGLWKESQRSSSLDIPLYFVKRISRLCIVIYPALLFILLLNLVGIYGLHGLANGIYSQKALYSLQPSGFACNAGFMQTGLCEPYGDDGALWSLFNEFWYYVTWPLFLLGILNTTLWKRGAFLLSGTAILGFLTFIQLKGTSAIGPYMLIWGLGIMVAVVSRPLIRSSVVSSVLFLLGLSIDRLAFRREYIEAHPVIGFVIDMLIGLLFANMLVTLRFARALRAPRGTKWHTWLASFSFSLYCIHIPILNAYGAALKFATGSGWQMVPDRPSKWALGLSGIALSVLVAYGFSRLTEAHTERFRQNLLALLRRLKPRELT